MRFSKVLFICLISFFWIQLAFSQHYIPGYYIDNQGVKHSANFKFLFDQEDYKEFIVLSDTQELKLFPDAVSEVGFENGRLFQSKNLPGIPENVFVLILRQGEVDLIKWEKQYFITRGEEIIALKEISSSREENGQQFVVKNKQYQGVLLAVLKPSPEQVSLNKYIRTANLNDKDLSRILDLYHELNGFSQDKSNFITQGPAFRTTWKLQVGAGLKSVFKEMDIQNFEYKFKSGISPYFEAGLRFRDFKNAPRIFADLGVGYYVDSDQLLLTGTQLIFDVNGVQQFTSSSIVFPAQIHYILSKGNSSEWYTGAGLTFWVINHKNDSAEVILTDGGSNGATLTDEFVRRKSNAISPNLKLGWSKTLSKSANLFLETKVDFLIKNYEMVPSTNYSVYHLGVFTFSTGITF